MPVNTMRKLVLYTSALALCFTGLIPAGAAGEEAGAHAAAAASPFAQRFGVASSHIKLYDAADMDREFAAMEDIGAAWIRCDFAWTDLEYVRGGWNFSGSDKVVEKAGGRGVKILGILGASPPWANGGKDWRHPPTDMEAWRNYVRTVVARYAGRVAAWEVWNEENIHAFWQPEPDPAQYVNLLAAASPEIRSSDPEATVVMGGVAGLGSDYLDACLRLGAAEHIDAIAYHPYAETIGVKGQPEEEAFRPKEPLCRTLVEFVHWLVAQHTTKDLEVWITEVGWTTCAQAPPGVDVKTQADYMLRTLINYASTDVDRVIWFNLRDTQLNDWDRYGLLDMHFRAKPAYGYYSTFCEVFGPATSVDTATVSFTCGSPNTLEAHCFRTPAGDLAFAAWKSDDAGDTLSFTVNDPGFEDAMSVDPSDGEAVPLAGLTRDASGRISVEGLTVGKTPLVVRLMRDIPEPEPEPEPEPAAKSFYFAEGYTGEGFQEYLCVGNTGSSEARVEVEFFFPDGASSSRSMAVPAGSRGTLDVNAAVGQGREVSMIVTSEGDIVAERPMYFMYGGKWTGGHVVMGARKPSTTWYFAEGYTGEGFEEWLCVLNPGTAASGLTLRFQTQEAGAVTVGGFEVGPRSRASFKVNDILGADYQASCAVEASQPVVVERPMYFDYRGAGSHHWEGGHCVMGATSLAKTFLFAEGTTREGFEEWLALQNPHDFPIEVEAAYGFAPGQGDPRRKTYRVEGGRRLTIFVPDEVGTEKDVSIELSSAGDFLAERPTYFDYTGAGAGHWQGGHCVIGAVNASSEAFFAEGYTGNGYHEWLCLYNPGDLEAVMEVVYLTQERGALEPRTVTVPPGSRITIFVNQHAGSGYQLSCRLRVISGPPVVAERPMYFSQGGLDGGHVVTGYGPG